MTKEEEKLLLTDLCSRIPYGVRVKFTEFSSLKDKELIGINTYGNDMPIVTCRTENGIITMPLKYDEDGSVSRPYVDWVRVEQLLKEKGVIDYHEKHNNTWRESINVCD